MNIKLLLNSVFTLLIVSQPAFAVSRSSLNSSIDITYGIVEKVERTKIDSSAGKGAVMGGVIGAATSGHHHRTQHALTGALAAGILTAILEGKRDAYVYLIETVDGSEKKVITEQGDIREGDCVSVEEGSTTNVRRVPKVQCEHHNHDVMSEPIVEAKAHEDAAECHAAKKMALKADTEDEVDIALKKVQVFCD